MEKFRKDQALLDAITAADPAAVSLALLAGANPNATFAGNRHPLYVTASLPAEKAHEAVSITRALLRSGAEVNALNGPEAALETVGHKVVKKNQWRMIEPLTQAGFDWQQPNSMGKTPRQLISRYTSPDAAAMRHYLDQAQAPKELALPSASVTEGRSHLTPFDRDQQRGNNFQDGDYRDDNTASRGGRY